MYGKRVGARERMQGCVIVKARAGRRVERREQQQQPFHSTRVGFEFLVVELREDDDCPHVLQPHVPPRRGVEIL